MPLIHLHSLLRGPVFPPLPSTQVNTPSPRLLGWHPALPRAKCVPAMLGGTAAKHGGISLWGAWWWEGEGSLALRSGCCREHPLVGAGHRDLLSTDLYLLITGGELGSHLWTSQRQMCVFWAWLEVEPKGERQKLSNVNFFSSFDSPSILSYQPGPAEFQLKIKPLLFKVPILCLASYETETSTLSLTWGVCLPA